MLNTTIMRWTRSDRVIDAENRTCFSASLCGALRLPRASGCGTALPGLAGGRVAGGAGDRMAFGGSAMRRSVACPSDPHAAPRRQIAEELPCHPARTRSTGGLPFYRRGT